MSKEKKKKEGRKANFKQTNKTKQNNENQPNVPFTMAPLGVASSFHGFFPDAAIFHDAVFPSFGVSDAGNPKFRRKQKTSVYLIRYEERGIEAKWDDSK